MHFWVCTSFFRATWSKFVTNFRPNFKQSQICLTNIDAKVPVHTFACLQPIKAMTKLLEFLGMRTHITKMVQLWLNQPYPTMSSVRVAATYLQALCTFILTLASSQASAMFLELMSQPAGEQCTSQSEYVNGEFHSSSFSGVRIIYSEPSSLAKCSTLISYHVMLSMTRV